MYDASTKSVFPYELSVAVLLVKEREEKESEIVDLAVREDRLRYIPPPLTALHDRNEE